MESSFPSELWQEILSYLEISEIYKLKQCGNGLLWRKLGHGCPKVHLDVRNHCCPASSLSSLVGPPLRSLTISLIELGSSITSDPSWLLVLPPTLESIDFTFSTCSTIWIRPATSGGIHCSLLQEGYLPVFICDLLPNLLHLKLRGQRMLGSKFSIPHPQPWEHSFPTDLSRHYHKQVVFRPPIYIEPPTPRMTRAARRSGNILPPPPPSPKIEYEIPPPTILYSHSSAQVSKRSVDWTATWTLLWLKKLPPHLQTLQLNFGPFAPNWLSYLPKSLTSFDCFVGISSPLTTNEIPFLPFLRRLNAASFMPSPVEYYLDQLRSLQQLDFHTQPVPKATLPLLPRSLHTLSLCAAVAVNTVQDLTDLVTLPSSITKLKLYSFSGPWKISKDATGLPDPLWVQNLPPHITDLTLLNFTSILPPLHFTLLGSALRKLAYLHVSLNDNGGPQIVYPSLDWVPIETLQSLTLEQEFQLQDKSFECWTPLQFEITQDSKKMRVNKLKTLILRGKAGQHLSCAIANSLPPNLTNFTVDQSDIDPYIFLQQCPRSLTKVSIYARPLVSKPISSLPTTSLPPLLQDLHLSPLSWYRPMVWPKEKKEISTYLIKRWQNLPHNIWLRNETIPRAEFQFFETLTKINIPTSTLMLNTVIWGLPHLEFLAAHTIRSTQFRGGHKSFPPLKTLRLVTPPPPILFDDAVCSNLTELSYSGTADVEFMSKLSKLAKLDVFSKEVDTSDPHSDLKFCYQLPTSITWIRVDRLDESFWTREPPKLKSKNWPKEKRPDPVPLEQPIELVYLYVTHFTITESRLKSLAPHLKSIRVQKILFDDFTTISKALPRDLLEISHLDWVQAICPSVTALISPEKTPDCYRPDWDAVNGFSHAQGVLDYYSDEIIENLVKSVCESGPLLSSSSSISPTSIPIVSDPLFAKVVESLQSLPPSLTCLTTSDWLPCMSPWLPCNLTKLDLRSSRWFSPLLAHLPFQPLPDTLTNLAISCPKLIVDEFYRTIPRGLKELVLDGLQTISLLSAASLPAQLIILSARSLTISSELEHLPRSLTSLDVYQISSPGAHFLPPLLVHLSMGVALDWTPDLVSLLPPTLTAIHPPMAESFAQPYLDLI